MIDYDDTKEKEQDSARVSEEEEKQEVMCWKDPNKVCSCDHPQAGIFCGSYPFPTD
jgi:hypothetical protein